jgi:hypothetical protein
MSSFVYRKGIFDMEVLAPAFERKPISDANCK